MRGWAIARWYALGVVAWAAGVLLVAGPLEHGLPPIIRGTARGSFALFALSFAAPAFGRWRWVRDNAAWLFVAFAVSHLLHAVAITSLAVITRGQALGGRVDLAHFGGLLTYVTLIVIAAGYAKRGGAEVQRRGWAVAQELGLHYVWTSFALAYLSKALEQPVFWPLAVVAIALPLARWVGRRGQVST